MKIPISLLTLSGIVFFLLTGCQKTADDIILVPQDSSAIFNIVKNEPDCAIVTTEGNFFTATGFTNENIKIEVDVLQPGIWKYSTDTLNGFWFAGTGVFSEQGRKKMTLNAAGTPVLPGNYTFTVGTYSTSVVISVLNNNVDEETVGDLSYFKGTIDGVDYDFEASVQGPDNIAYGSGGIDTMEFVSFMARSFSDNPPGPATISVQLGYLYNATTSTEEDFKNLFKVGAYAFQDYSNPCIAFGSRSGITFGWTEPNGDTWMTSSGSRNQEGSSFTIVGIEDGHNVSGKYFVKVKYRVNCKLYNSDAGTFKDLINGEVVSYFIRP